MNFNKVEKNIGGEVLCYADIGVVNVAADQKTDEEKVRKCGQQGVPQTEINGQIIVVFDKTRINSLPGIN